MYRTFTQDKSLRRALLLVGVLTWMVLGASDRVGAQTYSFTRIDVPGAFSTDAYGINNAGQVVGHASVRYPDLPPPYGTLRGFVYTGGSFSMIDAPGASLTTADGINDAGQIVGQFDDATGVHGFIYTGGSFTTIDVSGPTGITKASGINNVGQIVGTFQGNRGFLYTGGSFTTIDVPNSVNATSGINDTGQIVGLFQEFPALRAHGFIYDGVSFTTIDVPGASDTMAFGINNAGDIVGGFNNAVGGGHGFLYTGGNFTTIDVPGSTGTNAHGINDRGQIVGIFSDATGAHGFIATPIPTTPPAITITATPETLWPPNGKLVPVTVSGKVTDAGSGVEAITATYAVIDEYGSAQPPGIITLGANGSYAFTVYLQASRNATDANGRQYIITVRAVDDEGNAGSATAIVTVPHDLGQGRSSAAR